jgi:hypothetical protein
MKKLLLILCLTGFTTITFAQSFNLGVKAGVNLSNLAFSGTGYNLGNQNTTGFHAGLIADIGFQQFSIQPGLFFITKGTKSTYSIENNSEQNAGTETLKTTLNYLELPINLLYKIQVAPIAKVYLGGGPYLGYGLSASNEEFTTPASGPTSHSSLSFGGGFPHYRNPDYGVNFIAGIEMAKRFTIDLNYSVGLGNLAYPANAKLQNRSAGLSVGYWFR